MKIEFKPNKISFDAAGFTADIINHVQLAMIRVEERYIEEMRKAVDETVTAPQEWLGGIKDAIHHIETIIAGNVITYVVGINTPQGSAEWERAMVVAYGMGELGLLGNMIWAGGGRMVWNNELAGEKQQSKVRGEHELPKSWYHAGSWFIQNATQIMKTMYVDLMEEALTSLPSDIVSRHIIVTAG